MGPTFSSPMQTFDPAFKLVGRYVWPFYGIVLMLLLTVFVMWDLEKKPSIKGVDGTGLWW